MIEQTWPTLLQQFLSAECRNADTRDAIKQMVAGAGPGIETIYLNRFNLTVDRNEGVVVVEDDLEPSDAGVERVPLATFVGLLSEPPAD